MDKKKLAYIIGVAIGDGNLSNPNGRATRLRVTCDTKYPAIIKNIMSSLHSILPNNKISVVRRTKNCLDISCYSNKLEKILEWKAKNGSKYNQRISIPKWISSNKKYICPCLKGLIETDGSVYTDRKYLMVNFTTTIPNISEDFVKMINVIGFKPNLQVINIKNKKTRYTIRITKNADKFIKKVDIKKK